MAAVTGVFLITAVCFNIFGLPTDLLPTLFPEPTQSNKQTLPHWEGWETLDNIFVLYVG